MHARTCPVHCARLFVTAKGYGDVAVVVIVDPDGSGAQGPGELVNTRIIAAPKRSAQAVVICRRRHERAGFWRLTALLPESFPFPLYGSFRLFPFVVHMS